MAWVEEAKSLPPSFAPLGTIPCYFFRSPSKKTQPSDPSAVDGIPDGPLILTILKSVCPRKQGIGCPGLTLLLRSAFFQELCREVRPESRESFVWFPRFLLPCESGIGVLLG